MNSVKRMVLMLKRDVIELYRPAAIVAGALTGAVLVLSLIVAIFGDRSPSNIVNPVHDTGGHDIVFGLLLILGGAVITSRAFGEVHDRRKNHEWFMLPAATHEKLLTRLALTTIGYPVAALVGYLVATALAAGLTFLLTGSHFGVFNPFGRVPMSLVAHFWVAQSIFFFGAAFFRKQHFVKTIFSLMASAIVIAILAAVIFRIVFTGYFDGFEPTERLFDLFRAIENGSITFGDHPGLERFLTVSGEILHWGVVAPLFWFMSYLRLREAEVSHGV